MTKNRFLPALLLLTAGFFAFISGANAQSSYAVHFMDYQRSIPKVLDMIRRKEDTLMKQFAAKSLVWPARFMYIRSFKYDSEMEVWVKNKASDKYKFFKTYKICAMAGSLGPKRMAGDYQVPEGFYYINEFNPRSLYHLSLGLNYPNASDRLLGDMSQPGGDIYIHGSCVTTGCIPITDGQIEELYILAAHAKDLGQDFIPVHIFPVNFHNQRSVAYLNKYLQNYAEIGSFEKSMRNAFYYFEKNHEVPPVVVNDKGEYVIEEVPVPAVVDEVRPDAKPVKKPMVHPKQPIPDDQLANVVDRLPLYPGGNDAFKTFIDKLSNNMVRELEPGQHKSFVMVEYIIDSAGKPVFANVLTGGNEKMNGMIQSAFTGMGNWVPASRANRNVSIKLKQSIMVEEPSSDKQ